MFLVLEDSLAKQISLLLIELQLCIRQPEKALSLITYLENQMCSVGSIKILDKNQKLSEPKEKKVSAFILSYDMRNNNELLFPRFQC